MIAYVGETRAERLRNRLSNNGIGLLVIRGRLATRAKRKGGKVPKPAAIHLWPRWCYDNAAFVDWKSGSEFDAPAFMADVMCMLDLESKPDFAVLPDIVAGGLNSLLTSMSWLHRLGRLGINWALAVQDGMRPSDIPWDAPFKTIFVGGTLPWKLDTAPEWIIAAKENGKAIHIGRIGTKSRVQWARRIGATSIDSSLPLWSESQTGKFEDGLSGAYQTGWEWDRPIAKEMRKREKEEGSNAEVQLNLFK